MEDWMVPKYHSTNIYTSNYIRYRTVQCGCILPGRWLEEVAEMEGPTPGKQKKTTPKPAQGGKVKGSAHQKDSWNIELGI